MDSRCNSIVQSVWISNLSFVKRGEERNILFDNCAPKKIQKETTTSTCGNFKTNHEPFPKHVTRNRTKQIQDMLSKYKPEPCQTHSCRLPQYNQFLKLGGHLSQKNLTHIIHHILYFSSILLTCSWFSGFFLFVKGRHFI